MKKRNCPCGPKQKLVLICAHTGWWSLCLLICLVGLSVLNTVYKLMSGTHVPVNRSVFLKLSILQLDLECPHCVVASWPRPWNWQKQQISLDILFCLMLKAQRLVRIKHCFWGGHPLSFIHQADRCISKLTGKSSRQINNFYAALKFYPLKATPVLVASVAPNGIKLTCLNRRHQWTSKISRDENRCMAVGRCWCYALRANSELKATRRFDTIRGGGGG